MRKELEQLIENLDILLHKTGETELSVKHTDYKAVFLGVLVQVLNSKTLFKRNNEVAEFLGKRFDIEFADYCKKSRPLMVGRTVKYFLHDDTDGDIKEYLNELYSFIIKAIEGKQNDLTWSEVIKSIKF